MYSNSILKHNDGKNDESADIEASGMNNKSSAYNHHQRATLLIVDRSIDYASAFAHDYSYGHMLYEIEGAKN